MYRHSQQQLSEYGLEPEDVTVTYDDRDVTVDRVAFEGDRIELGGLTVQVLETPGHTDCSISYYLMEKGILFLSETMGCLTPDGDIMLAMLKGYKQTVRSIEKGRKLSPDYIIAPHYGKVSDFLTKDYWNSVKAMADGYRDFILDRYRLGLTEDAIYGAFQAKYWHNMTRNQQPLEAFEINGRQIIKAMIAEQW
jgi:glyoxylase-like metal-dependent hydrolase (beta-lactamase superfamily II)